MLEVFYTHKVLYRYFSSKISKHICEGSYEIGIMLFYLISYSEIEEQNSNCPFKM